MDSSRSGSQSVTTSGDFTDEHVAEMDEEKLSQLVKDIGRENSILQLETSMYEKYLKTVDPKDLLAGVHLTPGSSQASSVQELRSVGRKNRTRSKGSYAGQVFRLTATQKCDIAQKEVEDIKRIQSRLEFDCEKVLDGFAAEYEEAEARIAEIRRAQYEFERDIIKGAIVPRTNKIAGEKALRFLEDKVKAKDSLIEKLRLKNSTLRSQKKKLDQQLKQKEELGEVLHKVDFDQLQIENQQYLEKIDDKNQELLRLKVMAAKTLQILANYKKRLNTYTLEAQRLQNEITSRQDLLDKIRHESSGVEQERDRADTTNRHLKQQLSDYRVPAVMDYVQEKQNYIDLKQACRTWDRKVEIAEMALKTSRRTWQKIVDENTRDISSGVPTYKSYPNVVPI